ncbi:MAG: DUF4349 domain-containing protein [Defluviitaleaceae bacterium]|nr:DUF4349 domain-containing protein [Defluviitaleaceae bacterium]
MKHIRSNRTRIRCLFLTVVATFFVVFLLRLSYLIFTNNSTIVTTPPANMSLETYSFRRQMSNIATDRISQMDVTGNTVIIDQKYDKTANLSSVSHRFDEDHDRLRLLIDSHDAIVQAENLQGLPGNQILTMTIGVTPQQFDDMVNNLRELGDLRSFTVTRVDKTNEFNSLLAQQEVLRKTRDSYTALQELGGSIQDMLLLQERILAVETELQHLNVDLGIFATEHSFCTINFVLREQEASFISISIVLDYAFDSLLWTLFAAAVTSLITLGLLVVVILGLWLRTQLNKQLQAPETEDTNTFAENYNLENDMK